MKVNLGGVCGTNNWRETFLKMITRNDIEFFNPVVKNWKWNNDTKKEKENRINSCDYLIYYLAPPMHGFSSVASLIDYSNKFPEKILFTYSNEYENKKFTSHQIESLKVVEDIVRNNGGKVFKNLQEISEFLNDLK